jgi:predicted dehydrogenase
MPAPPGLIASRAEALEPRRTPSVRDGPFLIAGAGSIGTRHLANLRSLDCHGLRLYRTSLRPRIGAPSDVPVERELASAFRRHPRAVLVCNPTSLHIPVALAAARAGSHLFIEKPLSHSMEGVGELQAEVERRGLVAFVGFQFRFHPAFRQVRAWLAEGAIGEVVSVRVHWGEYLPGWHPGEDYRGSYSARRALGGGAVLTLSHPFDYLRFLLGEVAEVSAYTAGRGGFDLDVEDTAEVMLRFASGALGSVALDYVERPPSHGFRILGRKGSIRWNWKAPDGAARLFDAERNSVQMLPTPKSFGRNRMFLDEMRHFLACLEGREDPLCSLDDGVRALQIALAAKQAAAEGRTIRV